MGRDKYDFDDFDVVGNFHRKLMGPLADFQERFDSITKISKLAGGVAANIKDLLPHHAELKNAGVFAFEVLPDAGAVGTLEKFSKVCGGVGAFSDPGVTLADQMSKALEVGDPLGKRYGLSSFDQAAKGLGFDTVGQVSKVLGLDDVLGKVPAFETFERFQKTLGLSSFDQASKGLGINEAFVKGLGFDTVDHPRKLGLYGELRQNSWEKQTNFVGSLKAVGQLEDAFASAKKLCGVAGFSAPDSFDQVSRFSTYDQVGRVLGINESLNKLPAFETVERLQKTLGLSSFDQAVKGLGFDTVGQVSKVLGLDDVLGKVPAFETFERFQKTLGLSSFDQASKGLGINEAFVKGLGFDTVDHLRKLGLYGDVFGFERGLGRELWWPIPSVPEEESEELGECLLALEHLNHNDSNQVKAFTRDILRIPEARWQSVAFVLFRHEAYWRQSDDPFSYIKRLVSRLRKKEKRTQEELIRLPEKWDARIRGTKPALLYDLVSETSSQTLLVEPRVETQHDSIVLFQRLERMADRAKLPHEVRRLLHLRVQGFTIGESAERLGLSAKQIEAHRKRLERFLKQIKKKA